MEAHRVDVDHQAARRAALGEELIEHGPEGRDEAAPRRGAHEQMDAVPAAQPRQRSGGGTQQGEPSVAPVLEDARDVPGPLERARGVAVGYDHAGEMREGWIAQRATVAALAVGERLEVLARRVSQRRVVGTECLNEITERSPILLPQWLIWEFS